MELLYIYKITNTINNLSYIGFSKDPEKRFQNHKSNRHSKIGKAIKEFEVQNFSFDILYVSKDYLHTLKVIEHYFISHYNTYNSGYNQTTGGEDGKTYNLEVRDKISKSRKGMPSPRKGIKLTSETKKKISISKKGSQTRLGAKLSEESKDKIRLKNLGKKYSKEINNKKGQTGESHSNFGKKFSEERKKARLTEQRSRTKNQITINGITYRSKRHARFELRISYKTLDALIAMIPA